jgi:prepilin-type processing-associated H-X9-DG protein
MEQRRSLMSEDIVEMSVESAIPLSFAIGDAITVHSRTYTLNALPRARKGGMRQFGYDLTWEGRQYDLLRAAFLDTAADGVSLYADFSITGDLESLMNILINNLDRVYGSGKWILGICPETDTLTLTFANDNCLAVMQSLCTEDNFNVEFEITEAAGVCTIDLRVAVGVTHEEVYEYGRGKGLYGLQRQTVSNKNIVTRLYAFGASKNLRTDYRGYSQRLKLPSVDLSYIEDATALAAFGMIEAVKTFEEIFPHRTGTVTSLGDTIYKFVDSGMDFDLNAVDGGTGDTLYLMNGTSAKIHFNTGALAGYEFELSSYDHTTRTFTIKRLKDERDQEFPDPDSTAFQIAPGDEYVLIDIYLPASYVTAAEAELLAAAETYLAENCQPRVQYGLTFDEIHLARYAEGAAELFAPGDNIHVRDTDIGVDKLIRVRSLVRDLMADYRYALELSDVQHPSIISRLVAETIDNSKVIAMNKLNDPARARRNWRATQELLDMVFDPDGYFDGTRIKPESIETMMLSVGTRSQQLTLSAIIEPNYTADPEKVNVTGGALAHYAIEDDIRLWTITGGDLTLSSTASMYIYARCEKIGSAGTIIFTTDQITVDEDPSYYYFLLGVLHAASDGVRWISLTYGATAINGRYIRTGRIISQDGLNYFDLDQNEFKVGDASSSLDWNVTAAGQLTLKGALVQSSGGTTFPVGCFRGAYGAGTTYYRGDEVTNAGESWLYINPTPSSGHTPAEGAYWTKKAAAGTAGAPGADGADGTDGTNGNYIEYQYAKNGSTSSPPAIVPSDLNPSGWSVTPPSTGAGEYLWMTKATKDYAGTALISNWTTPVRIKGEAGAAGAAGAIGPSTIYRGLYNGASTYYGTATRVDVVQYSGSYYVARTDAPGGTFSGVLPTNTSYWNSFGANFESIATGLLFAELAYVDNLGVRVLKGSPVPVGDLAGTVTNITPNISHEPEWDPDTYYNVDDKCSDSGINYVCLIANIGEPLNLPYWSISTPQPQKRKDRITLSGTSGRANITCDSITRRIDYSSEGLTQTAADFVALYAADWTPGNVVLTSSGDSLYLESTIAGVDFTGSTTIVNLPNFYRGSIVIRGNEIWEDNEDNDLYGVVAINMRGYNGGYTRPRILVIGDGQGGLLARFGPGDLVTLTAAGISLPNLPGSNPGGGAANILWVDGSGYVRVGS